MIVAIGAFLTDVAGVKPAFFDALCGGIGSAKVTFITWGPGDDLAGFIEGHFFAVSSTILTSAPAHALKPMLPILARACAGSTRVIIGEVSVRP